MKKSIRSPRIRAPISCWTWILLVPLLGGCCKSKESSAPIESRELVCEPIAIFEVLEPERGAGAVPFSIERFGPEVKAAAVSIPPALVHLKDDNHMQVEWDVGTDLVFYTTEELVYSPAEGLARHVNDPSGVYPTRRFFDGKLERVWLGFRSSICREPDAWGEYVTCQRTPEDLFLVADMYCRWWIDGSPPEN